MMHSQPPALSAFSTDVVALLNSQRDALEQTEAGVLLPQVLDDFARKCEEFARVKVYVSFLLESTGHDGLHHVATSTLPAQYRGAIEDSAGRATPLLPESLGRSDESWNATDIATASSQPEWQAIALTNGLRAVWSWPIRRTNKRFAGHLICHFAEPTAPSSSDNSVLALMAQTVALILDYQAASHSMRDAQDRHRQIFNSATDFAIIATDLQGTVTDWNEGAHNVLGWTEGEALGFKLHRIFTPEDVACGRPEIEMRNSLLNGFSPDERWHLHKSGKRFWAVGQMTPLKSALGEVIGFVKVLRDRSDQKVNETEKDAYSASLENQVIERTRERDRIWQNSLDLLLEIRPSGVIAAVNPAWTSALGYSEDDLVDHYFEPFVHPDDVQATVSAIATASVGPLEHFQVRLRHTDGSYRWFDWRAAPEAGVIYANGRDITVEKVQEEQLSQANEARLQLALEAGRMGVWEWNIHSDEMIWLQGAAGVHGLAPSEGPLPMPLMGYLAYVHPDDQQVLAGIMTEALRTAQNAHAEYRVTWPDGSLHWLEARGYMIVDEQGAGIHMVGVSTDVTERKRTEADLKFLAEASAELSGLADTQSTLQRLAYLAVPHFADWCTAYLLQSDSTLKQIALAHVNPDKVQLASDFSGRFPPEINTPRGVWQVIRSGKVEYAREVTAQMLDENIRDPGRKALLKSLGLRSYITVPLRVHGKVLGAVSFFAAESGRLYDEKDVKLAEDLAYRAAVAIDNANLYLTLEQSDKAKSVFLATLSHELRNPLAAMMNGLSLMQMVIDDKKRLENTMKLVSRQAAQLNRLVDDLLDVSRIATGKIFLQKKTVDLTDILTDAVETTRLEMEANRHTLTLNRPEGSTQVSADPVRLLQVFCNLLTNAARYTNPGGHINVTVEHRPGEFVVRIRDNGIGIEAEMLPKIFSMFTQVVHPVHRTHAGLGIGLSLVDGLVKLHGGRVEAFSEGLGHGSEFVVHLPDAQRNTAENVEVTALPDESEVQQPARRNILVVDDNQDAANTLAELLRAVGQDVTTVYDGLSAVSMTETIRPDVVILDIGLPGIDGYQAAQKILAQASSCRPVLIALTGWGEANDKLQAQGAGFGYHLVKPVEFTQVTDILLKLDKPAAQ